jgi:DNA-binding response OmpR family regulator
MHYPCGRVYTDARAQAIFEERKGGGVSRILLVEDDYALARGLVALIRGAGHVVDHVSLGEAALAMERAAPSTLMILDIGLPDQSGFSVLDTLRRSGSSTPVLILTARDALVDRIRGLDLGGDDYLLKPFEPDELLARIRALVRRGQGAPAPLLTCANLTMDQCSGQAFLDGKPLDLRRREAAVLSLLMPRQGRVVHREKLLAEVFGLDEDVAPNALEIYVARLRKKFGAEGPRIRAIRGVGYILEP